MIKAFATTLVAASLASSPVFSGASSAAPVAPVVGAAAAPRMACNDNKNRRVTMINDTTTQIDRLYGSKAGAKTWEEDVLGDRVLSAGRTLVVNWDDNSCYCTFDFKAVYHDGTQSVKYGVNVCTIETFRFYN